MFGAAVQVANVWGIPIRLHISLLIPVIMLARSDGMLWTEAVLVELAFCTCIALHELGHSIVAIKKGCRVRRITLLVLGGVAEMEQIPTRPMDEFLMAIAGPIVSAVLGALLLSVGIFVPFLPRPLRTWILRLGGVNIILAVFNLAPAFPMDGGRVLRALLSTRMGRLKATFVASRVGQVVAILFFLWGLFNHSFWILTIVGIFIFIAARNEYKAERLKAMARAAGFGTWADPSGFNHEPVGENEVVVSPPPYQQGPGQRTEIQPERRPRNPFDRLRGNR